MEDFRLEVDEIVDVYASNTSKDFVGSIDRYTKARTEKALEDAFSIKPSIYTSERTKGVLEGAIEQNVNLIKGLSDDVLKNIHTIVHEATVNGNGVEDIYNNLRTQYHLIERRAKLIAYDQTRKITSQLTNQRARDAGAEEFEWLHSGKDAHPRRLHQQLNGKIFRYDDPPVIQEKPRIKGLPSQLINCKCQAIPVFRVEKEEPRRDTKREYKRATEKVRAMRTDYYGMNKGEQERVQKVAESMYDKYKLQVESIEKTTIPQDVGKGGRVVGMYYPEENKIDIDKTRFSPGKFKQESRPRDNVGVDLESVLTHEYGHVLENQGKARAGASTLMYNRANRYNHIEKISQYAKTNPQELLAEVFTAYTKGEKLPKYMIKTIEEMIQGYKKKK